MAEQEHHKENGQKKPKTKRPVWKRALRLFGWIGLFFFVLVILLILFVRSPWGQDIIVGKVTRYVAKKAQTEVNIDKLFITFSGSVDLEGLYLEDQKGDTLIYSEELQAGIPIWPIIKGEPIALNRVEWNGLRANVARKDSTEGFNYQFLIDAFVSEDEEEKPKTNTEEEADDELPDISIGSIDFSDFKVNYDDAVGGMEAHIDLGKFHFQGKDIDLDAMKFTAGETRLEDVDLSYEQTKPFSETEGDTTEMEMPLLSVEEIEFKNIKAHYKSIPDTMEARVDLDQFLAQVPKADLKDQDIEIGKVKLADSDIQFKMGALAESDEGSSQEKTDEDAPFPWPDWDVDVESVALVNNDIEFQADGTPVGPDDFDPYDLNITDFTFETDEMALFKDEKARAAVTNFSFRESSGIILNQLSFDLDLDGEGTELSDLDFETAHSTVNGDFKMVYASLDDLMNNPEKSGFDLDLDKFVLDLEDAYPFQPELKNNEYLTELEKNKFIGKAKAKGKLADLDLSEFLLKWGTHTRFTTNGRFFDLMDPDKLGMAIENFEFITSRSDLMGLVDESDLGIAIPETLNLNGQLSGTLDSLRTNSKLITSDGDIILNGRFSNAGRLAFGAEVKVDDLNLGDILQNPDIGQLAFTLDASGSGESIYKLNADLDSDFSKLEYNGYDFSALSLTGGLQAGEGDINLNYEDYNLDLDVGSHIQLDSLNTKLALDFNLNGADFKKLGLTAKDLKTKLFMTADFEGNADDFKIQSQISKAQARFNKENYSLGNVNLSAGMNADSTSLNIVSNFLNGKMRANADPDAIMEALGNQFKRYYVDSIPAGDTLSNPVRLSMNLDYKGSELIKDWFMPGLEEMEPLHFDMDFNQRQDKLTANIDLPYLNYSGNVLDNLGFKLNSGLDKARFGFGFKDLDAGAFSINQTFFEGDLKEGILSLNFHSFDQDGEDFYLVKSRISGDQSRLKFHLIPDELLLQGHPWNISESNAIEMTKDTITAKDFYLHHDNESMEVANNLIDVDPLNIGINFENFDLKTVLAFFNTDNYIASGQLQGDLVAVNPYRKPGLVADFGIDQLEVLQTPLGELSLKAFAKGTDQYRFKFGLKGDDVDLNSNGSYVVKQDSAKIDLDFDIDRLGAKTIADLSQGALKEEDASGYLSGNFSVEGETDSPDYEGRLKFNDAVFNVAQLNSAFKFSDDEIFVVGAGIGLPHFSVEDEDENEFVLNGFISTEDFTNPGFNLGIYARDFQAMNSSKEDSDLLYGKFNFDADGLITGKMNVMEVDLDIGINKETDITYVVPESMAQTESDDGIVEFVNKEHPDDILTRDADSIDESELTGIDVHTNIKADKEATFNVITDPRSGDNLQVAGDGDLDFYLNRNGSMNLSGRYTVSSGHYEMSLYGLVQRKFEFEEGSSITWQGDLMDPDLDFTAKYKVKTSASGLMASQTAGMGTEEQNKYNQVLPFWVFLNVKGDLDAPGLTFNLDMPKEARGAIDGSVYSRIQQLNEEDEGEVNKQVFSLLVLNRFFPESGSDGSSGGMAGLARQNFNQALSSQMNSFADKLTGNTGINLNFDLESYKDYQGSSPGDRTDLNVSAEKQLFNDRLKIKAGTDVNVQGETRPGEESVMVGDVSVEYLLTKDGVWRLKGFRNTEYDNIIDGQVFVNGIALTFQRQFNHLREMFKRSLDQKESDTKYQEQRKEDNEEEADEEDGKEASGSENDLQNP